MRWARSAIRGRSMYGLSCGSWFSSRRAGDVHRLVADPLEVGHDLHDRRDEAEVPRRRLVEASSSTLFSSTSTS